MKLTTLAISALIALSAPGNPWASQQRLSPTFPGSEDNSASGLLRFQLGMLWHANLEFALRYRVETFYVIRAYQLKA